MSRQDRKEMSRRKAARVQRAPDQQDEQGPVYEPTSIHGSRVDEGQDGDRIAQIEDGLARDGPEPTPPLEWHQGWAIWTARQRREQ